MWALLRSCKSALTTGLNPPVESNGASIIKFAGENAARTRDAVVPALVDKCFGSTRAGTKAQALELVLQYVEVENGAAGVVVCLRIRDAVCGTHIVFMFVFVRWTYFPGSWQSNLR